MTDLTRTKHFNEKKTHSVACAVVTFDQVPDTNLVELFNLPERCLIIDAWVIPEVAGQANLTADFGFAGGNEIINDVDIDDTAVKQAPYATSVTVSGEAQTVTTGTVKNLNLTTGTGKNVTAKFSAKPTAGRFAFIVEYVEYTLGNGNLTNYSA